MKQSTSPWLWQTFAVTFFCAYTTFDSPWSYLVLDHLTKWYHVIHIIWGHKGSFEVDSCWIFRSYWGHIFQRKVSSSEVIKYPNWLNIIQFALGAWNDSGSCVVIWGHARSFLFPVVHMKRRGHLRSNNNSKRAWDSICMAKDTFFLDCDGKLHLLHIDRLETACEGSNGALLMLSRLLQKNAKIIH